MSIPQVPNLPFLDTHDQTCFSTAPERYAIINANSIKNRGLVYCSKDPGMVIESLFVSLSLPSE